MYTKCHKPLLLMTKFIHHEGSQTQYNTANILQYNKKSKATYH